MSMTLINALEDCTLHKCELNHGMFFFREHDIVLSGHKWIVIIDLDIQDFDALVDYLDSLFTLCEQTQLYAIKTIKTDKDYVDLTQHLPWEEIRRLKVATNKIKEDIAEFKLLFRNEKADFDIKDGNLKRKARGLINLGGIGLKYLFGTATESDLLNLNTRAERLEKEQKTLVHNHNELLTYVKRSHDQVKGNTKSIQYLGSFLNSTLLDIVMTDAKLKSNISDIYLKFDYHVQLNSIIRQIEQTINLVRIELNKLRESLDVTSLGRLSSVLVSPTNLSQILQYVALKLPDNLKLLTTTELDKMYEYYSVSTVHAVGTLDRIRLFVEIPLKANDRLFELYKINTVPYYDPSLEKFVVIQSLFQYLAVSESRQSYMLLNRENLENCLQTGQNAVCQTNLPIYNKKSENCFISNFIEDPVGAVTSCVKSPLPGTTFNPIFIQSPDNNAWLYSVSSPLTIVKRCDQPDKMAKTETTLVLNGTGVLHETQNCYLFSDYVNLLPNSVGTSKAIKHNSIVAPSADFYHDYQNLQRQILSLNTSSNYDDQKLNYSKQLSYPLSTLFSTSLHTSKDIDLTTMVTPTLEDSYLPAIHYLYGVNTILILLLIAMALYLCYLKNYWPIIPCFNRRRPTQQSTPVRFQRRTRHDDWDPEPAHVYEEVNLNLPETRGPRTQCTLQRPIPRLPPRPTVHYTPVQVMTTAEDISRDTVDLNFPVNVVQPM